MTAALQYLATGESTTVDSRMPAGRSASCKGPAFALVSISCRQQTCTHRQGVLGTELYGMSSYHANSTCHKVLAWRCCAASSKGEQHLLCLQCLHVCSSAHLVKAALREVCCVGDTHLQLPSAGLCKADLQQAGAGAIQKCCDRPAVIFAQIVCICSLHARTGTAQYPSCM